MLTLENVYRGAILCVCFCIAPSLLAGNIQLPAISIIIDDIGNGGPWEQQLVELPDPITISILPHTPHSVTLAKRAHTLNKEVMLHLPMQPMDGRAMGPGGITVNMDYNSFHRNFAHDLQAVPHVMGINNHMGSLLTQHPKQMEWLMRCIMENKNSLFFVDSLTIHNSIAGQVAEQHWVPNLRRDVFLDHDPDIIAVNRQFNRLLETARQKGFALAIGHPYPQTLKVLQKRLPSLEQFGVNLVPVSHLIKLNLMRTRTWRAYLSP